MIVSCHPEVIGFITAKSTYLKRAMTHSNTAMRGSGIFQRGGTLTVSNSIIENNGADALTTHGGAISLDGRIGSAFSWLYCKN